MQAPADMPDMEPGRMESVVYVSSAVRPFSSDDLKRLLETARWRNSVNGVTGMLAYCDGNFVQAIEGDPEALALTLDIIREDRRHRGLTILLREPIEERRFPEWSMAFHQPSEAEILTIPGYHRIVNGSAPVWSQFASDPARTKRLMATLASHL